MEPSHESNSKKLNTIIRSQENHELLDNERFNKIEQDMKGLATKKDIEKLILTLTPIAEAWATVRNGRNGLVWIAATIATVGGAMMVLKGLFK